MHLLTGVNHQVEGVKTMTDTDHTAIYQIEVDIGVVLGAVIAKYMIQTTEMRCIKMPLNLKVGSTICEICSMDNHYTRECAFNAKSKNFRGRSRERKPFDNNYNPRSNSRSPKRDSRPKNGLEGGPSPPIPEVNSQPSSDFKAQQCHAPRSDRPFKPQSNNVLTTPEITQSLLSGQEPLNNPHSFET